MDKYVKEFRFESARCTVTIVGNRGLVSHVYSITRRRGQATALLTQVIEFADKNDLELILTARAYGSTLQTMLTPQQLRAFYAKFGFIVVKELYPAAEMARPRTKNIPYSEREN